MSLISKKKMNEVFLPQLFSEERISITESEDEEEKNSQNENENENEENPQILEEEEDMEEIPL
jgi:hypothetical protein